MSRGIRKDTPDRIRAARERLPLSIGPWLGELCIHFNITASMVATIIDTHDQTVLRWFFGQTEVTVMWIKPAMKLLCLLAWMHSCNDEPLTGSVKEKMAELNRRAALFGSLTQRAA